MSRLTRLGDLSLCDQTLQRSMPECKDLVHFRRDETANGEFASEPPRQFAKKDVADDHGAAVRLEAMFMSKTREGPVRQFLGELVRRIEHASKELKHNRNDAVDHLPESRDAWFHPVDE